MTVSVEHREEQANRWNSSTHRTSAVALYVYDAADVELTITEILRLSHLAYSSADGFVLEQHGDLLRPGTTRLRLEVGVYHFKCVNDVQLRIDQSDAVQVVTPQTAPADLRVPLPGRRP